MVFMTIADEGREREMSRESETVRKRGMARESEQRDVEGRRGTEGEKKD